MITILKEEYIILNGKHSIISLFLKCSCVIEKTLVSNESLSSYCTSLKCIFRLLSLYKIRNEMEKGISNGDILKNLIEVINLL